MAEEKKQAPDDPFDIAGAEDRNAEYLDKLAAGEAYRLPKDQPAKED